MHPFGILHWFEGILLSNEHHPTSTGFSFVHTVAQDTLLTLYVKEAESSSQIGESLSVRWTPSAVVPQGRASQNILQRL